MGHKKIRLDGHRRRNDPFMKYLSLAESRLRFYFLRSSSAISSIYSTYLLSDEHSGVTSANSEFEAATAGTFCFLCGCDSADSVPPESPRSDRGVSRLRTPGISALGSRRQLVTMKMKGLSLSLARLITTRLAQQSHSSKEFKAGASKATETCTHEDAGENIVKEDED